MGRIQTFRESIRNGRKYPCVCCHRICFQNGVTEYSNDFHAHVTEKYDDIVTASDITLVCDNSRYTTSL